MTFRTAGVIVVAALVSVLTFGLAVLVAAAIERASPER